jgi:hypothetical protein
MSVRADIIDKLKEICELAVTTATLGQWDLEPKVVVKPSGPRSTFRARASSFSGS